MEIICFIVGSVFGVCIGICVSALCMVAIAQDTLDDLEFLITANTKDIDPQFVKTIDEHFWELI